MKRAVVLTGGFGTRLRPYTAVILEPLMPVGEQPILEIVLRQLRRHGFRERETLGTVGALAMVKNLEHSPFLVMNGDVLTNLDYGELLRRHTASDAAATIAVTRREVKISLGVLKFEDAERADRVTDYVEKPSIDCKASMGVYCFSPCAVRHIETSRCLGFPDLILRLIAAGEVANAWRSSAYWLDIGQERTAGGRHDDYEQAMEDFERMRDRLLPNDPTLQRR